MIKVNPQEVRGLWAFVREGLERVAEKATDGWIPEDVYAALITGKSTLYLTEDKQGFAVLFTESDYKGLKLKVWAAYHKGSDGIKRHLPFIKELAREIGARCVTFDSTRKGYEKIEGMNPKMQTFEVEI